MLRNLGENLSQEINAESEQSKLNPDSSSPIAKLKAAVLVSQTLGELYALMEDYSYQEFMQVYNQLTPKQQAKLEEICDRDSQMQMAAANTPKNSDFNGKQPIIA